MTTTGKDVFRRNGFEVSWASATAKIDNDEFFGFTEVNYEEKLDRAFTRGMGKDGAPRGTTRGQYSVEGSSLKLYKSSALALIEKLCQKSRDGKSWGQVPFFFSLQYVEEGNFGEEGISITEELYGCKAAGRKASVAQGPEGLVDEIPITVMYAKLTTPNIAGMTLFDNRQRRF